MSGAHDLERFIEAQGDGVYERALAELKAGRKASHWMWFVFPQVAGLGRSDMSVRFALAGIDEASAYWAHPVLGARYEECCRALFDLGEVLMDDVLGSLDAQKLHSSLTLFSVAAPGTPAFELLLARHFGGEPDPATTALM